MCSFRYKMHGALPSADCSASAEGSVVVCVGGGCVARNHCGGRPRNHTNSNTAYTCIRAIRRCRKEIASGAGLGAAGVVWVAAATPVEMHVPYSRHGVWSNHVSRSDGGDVNCKRHDPLPVLVYPHQLVDVVTVHQKPVPPFCIVQPIN